MAVVAEYKFKNCTVTIHDDAYADASEEEIRRRVREAQRVAWGIWERAQRRERERAELEADTSSALRAPSPQGEG